MRKVARTAGLILVLGLFIGASLQPLTAQVTIPQGSTVQSAVFSIYALNVANQSVYLHRVTADWGELSVTLESLGGQWDSAVAGSFVTGSIGWHTVDLTTLVQAWVNGVYPNYGFLMMQDPNTAPVDYRSSEYTYPTLRPKLEVWYTTPDGEPHYVLIQRPDVLQDGVADATIRTYVNGGLYPSLTTGNVNGIEKYSIIRFHITVLPPSPGTGTPGYWMNHPEAWPEIGITIGGTYYPMVTAIAYMKKPVRTDMSYAMFATLVAAKLNVLIGNDSSCIAETIAAADEWMMMNPIDDGIPVSAGGDLSPWRAGEPLYLMLDAYNNGLLCAPSRD